MVTMYFILITIIVNMVHVNSYDMLKLHSPMFVDKTKFLEKFFLLTKSHRCIFLTSPPGFGKSTIVSMVDLYCGVEDNGNKTFKAGFFTETFKIFKDTNINPSTSFMGAHLAKYMIVKLKVEYRPENQPDFNIRSIYEALQKMVGISAERYEDLLQAVIDDGAHKEEADFLVKLSLNEIAASDLPFMLRNLIKILYKYYRHRIILLIDDYDTAAYGITHRTSNDQVETFYSIFNTMINYGIKLGPKYVHKALIVSTHSLPFYWSGETGRELEDFHHYEFLKEHVFTEFIGFTESEVQTIAENIKLSSDEKYELTKYCNGYQTYYNKTKIYKPICVENYIHTRLPAKISNELYDINFRSTFRDLEFIRMYLKDCDFEIQLMLLSYNKTIGLPRWGALSPAGISLNKFKELQKTENSNKSTVYRLMWTYLKEYGFVTPLASVFHFKAPNLEITHALQEFVLRYHDESKLPLNGIAKCLQTLGTSHNDLANKKVKETIHDLGTLLTECDKHVAGLYHKKAHELIYQAIIFASSLRTSWQYYSSHEVRYRPLGRCDMYLYNKHENVAAIVNIEYHGNLVILPNIFTTQFPHPNIRFLTVLSINVKPNQRVEISHSVREVGPKKM